MRIIDIKCSMVVDVNGEAFDIPIDIATYAALAELYAQRAEADAAATKIEAGMDKMAVPPPEPLLPPKEAPEVTRARDTFRDVAATKGIDIDQLTEAEVRQLLAHLEKAAAPVSVVMDRLDQVAESAQKQQATVIPLMAEARAAAPPPDNPTGEISVDEDGVPSV